MKYVIDITHPIFTIDPSIRFSKTMKVSLDFSEDMWRRYNMLEYSKHDLKEWFEYKTKLNISMKTIERWIIRQEIYNDAHRAVEMGAREVTIDYFKRNLPHIQELISE